MSVDSEEEEIKEEMAKSKKYKEIYGSKMFLKVYNRKKNEFEFKFPKSSCDKIIQMYGKERILPMSFILFSNPNEVTETIRYSSHNVNIRNSLQINTILDVLSNYLIYPASFENLDELEKIKRAPKIKPAYLKNIASKMGKSFSEMINYISLQMTEINVKETTKTVVSVQIYQIVFNLIHLLNVKFPDKESFEFAFYSYRKMLKMADIGIEEIIPYLELLVIDNQTREELLKIEKSNLFDKVLIRELKESIDDKIKTQNIDLYAGIESCERLPKPDPIILEPFREEASNLLLSLIGKGEKKDEEQKQPEEEKTNENERENEEEIEKKEIIVVEKQNEKEQPEIERQEINVIENNDNKDNKPEKENEGENKDVPDNKVLGENKDKDKAEPEKDIEENSKKSEPEVKEKNEEENLNNQEAINNNDSNNINNNNDENKQKNEELNEIKNNGENIDKNINMNIKLDNKAIDNKEQENRNKEEDLKNNNEEDNIIKGENMTLLHNEQNNESIKNPENIDKNEQKITDNKPEDDKDKESKDMIKEQIIISEGKSEPNKENEDSNKNKIIGQTVVFGEGNNDDNKNKEEELENNNKAEQNKIDLNIINSKKVLRAKKDTNKNKGKDDNKNKIEDQIITAENRDNNLGKDKDIKNSQIPDKKQQNKENDNIISGQIIGTGINNKNMNNNDLIHKNMVNNEKINKNENIGKGKKGPKKQFKIRRAVFLRVEK